MGGLLSLACLVICPGVKVCTHRGCPPLLPPRPGGASSWLAESRGPSESEFLLRVAATTHPGLPFPPPSASPLLDTLPHLSLSGTPVRGLPGSCWFGANERRFAQPWETGWGNRVHPEPTLITSHHYYSCWGAPSPPFCCSGEFVLSSSLCSDKECKERVWSPDIFGSNVCGEKINKPTDVPSYCKPFLCVL